MKKFIVASMVLAVSNLFAMSGLEVAQKADKATSGFESSISVMQMVMINSLGQKTIRDMRGETFEQEGGDKSLIEFLSPADVKGTKLLTYQHTDKDDDQWLYIPALKRVKRISSRSKTESFMGGEFSYEDISSQEVAKYTYDVASDETILDGKLCYKGKRIPKDRLSGYTKQITWVDQEHFLVQKVDYYDRKSTLIKTAIFSDYKEVDGIWRVGKITMKNHQNDKTTILIWVDDKVKAGLTAKHFNKRVLKQ